MRLFLCMLLMLLIGCAAPPESTGEAEAEPAEAIDAARHAVEAERVGLARMIESMPEVGAAQVSVGTAIGGAGAANVAVTVVREDGGPVDEALAQRVVDQVIDVFGSISPSNVAIRDGGRAGFLYLGDLGRID
ncbi:hypothetical protein ACERK3_09100 [Phycisphaerales bacterium AB-hyl4]|uniref:Uncharacterized protein n=1 Tax=Natronomicrosphaera hydrolytica TaxID=3242702 RepID=A0ABV4U5K2_9BACT